jgi:hypothetical protein
MTYRMRMLAIPFGSPRERDLDGEYFSPRTDLGIKLTRDTILPLAWHHGAEGHRKWIGGCSDWEMKADGWWCTAVVEDPMYAARLAQAERPIFASSGAAPHTVIRAGDGEILQWGLSEVSGTFSPINRAARTQPITEGMTYDQELRIQGIHEVLENTLGRHRQVELMTQANDMLQQFATP